MYCSNAIKYPVDFFPLSASKTRICSFANLRDEQNQVLLLILYLHYSPADKHINVSLTTHEGNKKKHSETKQYCFAHL